MAFVEHGERRTWKKRLEGCEQLVLQKAEVEPLGVLFWGPYMKDPSLFAPFINTAKGVGEEASTEETPSDMVP